MADNIVDALGDSSIDYMYVTGSGLGTSTSVAMNAHNGEVYYTPVGGSVPATPGAALMFGNIIQSNGYDQKYLSTLTDNYLSGGSWSIGGCVLLCVGVNHSYGVGTAIEWGISPSAKSSGSFGTGYSISVGNPLAPNKSSRTSDK